MSNERRKIETMLNPLALVAAILNYVIASLPHPPEEELDPGDVTFEGLTPPLTVSSSMFWLQFGKRKRFKHAGLEIVVTIPPAALMEMTFLSVLAASKAKGLGAFNEFLDMFNFPKDSEEAMATPEMVDALYRTFTDADAAMQAKGIVLLRLQFAFEIVRYTLLGETIKFLDTQIGGAASIAMRADLAADRQRCVNMRSRFPYFVRFWGPFFRTYSGFGPFGFDWNEPIKTFIPENLWSWIDLTN